MQQNQINSSSNHQEQMTADEQRRFAGTQKLYGEKAFEQFQQAHVMVIGIGGVGSWAVEALARSGVGHLTLIDMDVVASSNVNRQLPALTSTLGHEKIAVMAQRCREINPHIQLDLIDDYLTAENVQSLLSSSPDVVLDCIDDVQAKLALIVHCRFHKIPLIVSGGAGGKVDPTQIKVADLARTQQDPMLAKIRNQLRRKGICKNVKEKFGLTCIYSEEQPKLAANSCATAGLHCGGYGSAVAVTSSFAMFAVAEVLKKIPKAIAMREKKMK
ncbi:MAG: tRNA threonylcarbamoyladenosine dehydratase [Acinetobacter sp.]|nr:tRNA threonylcarbamoyladenosine dehydratase [Acinetobacter sp.]